ncbi:ArsR family transcriptional regulator [Pacificimonas flava]|uniref:ArsR family transcriptional regulator n=2 Tax=Pacificimonas TaxID=1960290 RepID=A0A219B2L1_9SPHN|nr:MULTISPECIES: metalloregulator ArsR/SmtB family transcription factor [Pacificimonas]MBZ6377928.1 metalloregulator ArsR/SmtB family transcription factor [Pacificimonas aurantium]OWV32414.1 ArsR family transcriptional regulator [Pacificimonas flava]
MFRPMIAGPDLFRALGDETRLRILHLVRQLELTVGDLTRVLGQSQPRVSRHVRILAEAGLLERNREGAWVFVRYAESELAARVADVIDLLPSQEEDTARLNDLRSEQLEASTSYFNAQAETWDRFRRLHVADDEVERRIVALLSERPVGRLLDIGTGTGRMLELLANKADSALGIDRSVDMLRAARAKLDSLGLGNCAVRQGDMHSLPSLERGADTIIIHQALHFAERPSKAVDEAARVLSPGGRLLVVDFAPHDREELRSEHAHSRLGFADETLCHWMRRAGLEPLDPEHLKGTLTVTIWTADKPAIETRKVA